MDTETGRLTVANNLERSLQHEREARVRAECEAAVVIDRLQRLEERRMVQAI